MLAGYLLSLVYSILFRLSCEKHIFFYLFCFLHSLTLVVLNPDMPRICKQCRSTSVGLRSQLIGICSVCHLGCEFVSTTWNMLSDCLEFKSGRDILTYSAWQGYYFLIPRKLFEHEARSRLLKYMYYQKDSANASENPIFAYLWFHLRKKLYTFAPFWKEVYSKRIWILTKFFTFGVDPFSETPS